MKISVNEIQDGFRQPFWLYWKLS